MIYAKGIPLGEERLIEFSVLIIKIVNETPNSKVGNHLSGQLFRSGTSVSLNYGEASRWLSGQNQEKTSFTPLDN